MGLPKNTAPLVIGLPAYLFSFGSAIYCDVWIAKCAFKNPAARIAGAAFYTLLLMAVYLFVMAGGCAYVSEKL
jgi:hypothetical protein